ncbi:MULTISPECIES: DUF3813 domain-containing protein [Bacillaceae]|uniref:DUF3813 domain-containing protein n=1 Tax=Evansella alkalicola TaxID=745819 RepID=A0ABS6JTB7_9BACI|nr:MULTISPECIES: DUF3813 domain-containing protein [Bacillaceae]MBU9721828.1 DUF3813 domain-containing protein [Bacillus alkalicola]
MANRFFQEAREAVEEAQQAIQSTTTPLEQDETEQKIKRAKQAISQAYADSTLAERRQIMDLQQTLYEFAEEFSTEDK